MQVPAHRSPLAKFALIAVLVISVVVLLIVMPVALGISPYSFGVRTGDGSVMREVSAAELLMIVALALSAAVGSSFMLLRLWKR